MRLFILSFDNAKAVAGFCLSLKGLRAKIFTQRSPFMAAGCLLPMVVAIIHQELKDGRTIFSPSILSHFLVKKDAIHRQAKM